jgi:hypothetical protein
MSTPITWEPERWPTPEEARDWFLSCTPDEQLRTATRAVRDMQTASDCFLMNHRDAEQAWADGYNKAVSNGLDLTAARTADLAAQVARVEALRDDLLDFNPGHGDFLTAGRSLDAALAPAAQPAPEATS